MCRQIQTHQHKIFFIKDILQREKITVTHCPTERMIADYFTKPLLGKLFTVMRDVIMGITPYPSKERVENKICTGTEQQEINSSTEDEKNKQVSKDNTASCGTVDVDQVQDMKSYDKDSTKEACTQNQVKEQDQEPQVRSDHEEDRV